MTTKSKVKITVTFVFLSLVLFLALPVRYQVYYSYCPGSELKSDPPQCEGEFKYYSEGGVVPVIKLLPMFRSKTNHKQYPETIKTQDLYPIRFQANPFDIFIRGLAASTSIGGVLYIIKRRTRLFK